MPAVMIVVCVAVATVAGCLPPRTTVPANAPVTEVSVRNDSDVALDIYAIKDSRDTPLFVTSLRPGMTYAVPVGGNLPLSARFLARLAGTSSAGTRWCAVQRVRATVVHTCRLLP